MTPTTSCGSPFNRTLRPTTAGSAPKRRVQKACERTTRRFRPGAASSSRKVRPSSGSVLNARKNPGLTRKPASCSGTSTSERFGSQNSAAAKSRQHRALAHPVAVVGRRDRAAVGQRIAFRRRGHDDQPIDAGKAERPEVERIGQAEHGSVGRQRQRQRHDDGGRERWASARARATRSAHRSARSNGRRARHRGPASARDDGTPSPAGAERPTPESAMARACRQYHLRARCTPQRWPTLAYSSARSPSTASRHSGSRTAARSRCSAPGGGAGGIVRTPPAGLRAPATAGRRRYGCCAVPEARAG